MKFLNNKIYIIVLLLISLLFFSEGEAKNSQNQYTEKSISNYFLGIVSSNQDYNVRALKHLKEVTSLKNKHSQFNIEFLRTLVLLEKFDEAISFSNNIWKEEDLFFEVDLLLGLNYFMKKDYKNSEKYFERLNEISEYNFFFRDFIGNVLAAWSRASQGDKEGSFNFLERVPKPYRHIIKVQDTFIECYFDSDKTEQSFVKLISDKEYNFSRYNFFLSNYLLHNNQNQAAEIIINLARKKNNSNILIKQTENFFINNKSKKIKDYFNCKNSKDSLAEFFYILANLYASEKEYKLSNFYLKISLFLNENFLTNKALLAENLFYQNQNGLSKNIYNSIKSIGQVYSWHASKSLATIIERKRGKKYSIESLEKEFKSIKNPSFEHYFDLANFYKDYEYYEQSIKYYSLALKNIEKNHSLIPKILDRRGTSFERMGDWKKAEKDLMHSLRILPDQPQVLNYLAYTWVDKGVNLDKGLEMLKKAMKLKEGDGYIIDSIGWAYYAKKNYHEAEFFLQKAVELLPLDPIINDHYADALWKLNKNIQARYFWNYVLKLNNTEQKLKDEISEKLIFGIKKEL